MLQVILDFFCLKSSLWLASVFANKLQKLEDELVRQAETISDLLTYLLQEDLQKLDYLKKENLSRKEAILSQFPSLAAEEAEPKEKR